MKTNYLIIYAVVFFIALKVQAQQPIITSFSPTSGPIGTSVTLSGQNFNTSSSQNIVYFGATKATVTSASSNSLTVTVPTGATFQPISVLNSTNGLIGYSSKPFNVTYTGESITSNNFATKVDFTASTEALNMAMGDLDGDGKSDLVTVNFSANTILVLRNTATAGSINGGSFAAKVDFATNTNPRGIAIGDIDGDGKPEVVVTNFNSNNLSVFRNTSTSGAISFAAKIDFTTGNGPRSVNIADFDSDGKPELAVAHAANVMSVFRNTSTSGSISFQAKVDFALTAGNNSTFVGSSDFDADGKLDIAVCNNGLNNISVFKNTSTSGSINASSFAAKVDFSTGGGPFGFSIGDFDGDEKPDLAAANFSENTISVIRNTATNGIIDANTFAAKVDFNLGGSASSTNVADIDGDGKLDLLAVNLSSNQVSIFRNTATSGSITTSSFAAKVDFTTASGPRYVCIGDLDGDNRPDLAVTTNTANVVSVFRYVEVVSNPTGTANQAVCQGNTASLAATCVVGTVNWYDANSVAIPFTGSPFTTPALSTNTTYKVRCEQGASMSSFVDVVVTVNPKPAAPTLTANGPTTICNGGSVVLNSNLGNNNALNFVQANSQYITVPHSASINLTSSFTMEAWVNYSGKNATIVDKGNYDFLWQLNANADINGNTNQMGFFSLSTGTWSYSSGAVPQNTWTHVAITLNAGTLTFYTNGVASGTASVTIGQDNQPMNIGRQQPTYCVCNHFNGTMDELRMWNIVRTPAEILTNMNATVPTNSVGLVAYYKFDEGTGTTTADASGNGNNGTFINNPTWQVPSTSPVNQIVWSPGGATTSTLTVTTTGTYTATITNGFGCNSSTSITINAGSNASLVNLTSPTDDYSSNNILKTASSVNGKIVATNKVTGTAKVDYRAKSVELNAGFRAENGTVFSAAIGGCN